jgi:capsular exopolysaccharide synthesis family protein
MSRIFEALNEAGKDRVKSEAPKASLLAKVGPPQLATDSHRPNPSAEEYYRLRQRISGIFPGTQSKTLMFVGSSEAEDNATVAASFGYTVAWNGESAVLVDANRQTSTLHRILGTDQDPGMTELLSGKAGVQEVLRLTDVSKLLFVPGGAAATAPISAGERAVFMDSLNALKTSADWIILNAPPANGGDDLAVLSAIADGVVLVISAEKTRWEDALSAKETLCNAGANILGAIFTGRKTRIPSWLERWLR